MSLSLQLAELLEVVASLIHSASDLLTSKILHTIIVPEHLDLLTVGALFILLTESDICRCLCNLPNSPSCWTCWWSYMDVAQIVNKLRDFPSLHGATRKTHVARIPSSYNSSTNEIFVQPAPECLAALTSFAHLTHLDTSATIQYIADADDADRGPTHDSLLRALTVAPRLQYVGVDVIHHGVFRPVLTSFSIVRDAHGQYARRRDTRDLRRVRYHDWDGVFRVVGSS
ncbi:hypothetical protein C8R44DRAFT_731331 [Mycena epipterygia]|nr:hypothetical protein C8R44DRAFT_731331 [Mycena epipterygia]